VMAVEEKIGAGQGCSLRLQLFYILFGNDSDAARGWKKKACPSHMEGVISWLILCWELWQSMDYRKD